MITLVPFYRDLSKNVESTAVTEMSNSYDYKKSLAYLIESFKKFNKKNRVVVATDKFTQIDHSDIFRSNLENMNLMESLTTSNTDYVLNNSGKIILCGSDHLIFGKVERFFEGEEFDLGIYINGAQVNNTAVLINKNENNKQLIDKFFNKRLEVYHKFDENTKSWFGDQMSYTEILQQEKIITKYLENKSQTTYMCDGLRIKIFEYGYLVKGCRKGGGLKGNSNNMILIDFKGTERKKHLDTIYQFVMKTN